jgi:hypothetical protein
VLYYLTLQARVGPAEALRKSRTVEFLAEFVAPVVALNELDDLNDGVIEDEADKPPNDEEYSIHGGNINAPVSTHATFSGPSTPVARCGRSARVRSSTRSAGDSGRR